MGGWTKVVWEITVTTEKGVCCKRFTMGRSNPVVRFIFMNGQVIGLFANIFCTIDFKYEKSDTYLPT